MYDGHLAISGIAQFVTEIWENPAISRCMTDIWKFLIYSDYMCDGHLEILNIAKYVMEIW